MVELKIELDKESTKCVDMSRVNIDSETKEKNDGDEIKVTYSTLPEKKERRIQVLRNSKIAKIIAYCICPVCDKIVLTSKADMIRKHYLDHFRKQILSKISMAKYCTKCDVKFGERENIVNHYAIDHGMLQEFISDDKFEILKIGDKFPDNIPGLSKANRLEILTYFELDK